MATSFARRIEPINIDDRFALLTGNMFENLEECRKAQVANLAPPHFFHPSEVQVLKKQHVVLIGQVVGQLEEPILAPVGNSLMHSGKMQVGPASIVGALFSSGQVAVGLADSVQVLLEELRRMYLVAHKTVVDGQEGLEAKIKPRHFTGRGSEIWFRYFLRQTQIQIAEFISLDCCRLDLANRFPVLEKLVDRLAYLDTALTKQFPTSLLKSEALVLAGFFKSWWLDLHPNLASNRLKEKLIAFLDSLHNVLQRLGGDQLQPFVPGSLLEFGQMSHQSVLVEMFAGQLVVAFVERKAVVVGPPGQGDGAMDLATRRVPHTGNNSFTPSDPKVWGF